jgi:hypothetical protein
MDTLNISDEVQTDNKEIIGKRTWEIRTSRNQDEDKAY